MSPKRKPNLIESNRGKEFYMKSFQTFLNNKNTKHIKEIHTQELFLQKDLILLSEISLKNLFPEKVQAIGLFYYLQ